VTEGVLEAFTALRLCKIVIFAKKRIPMTVVSTKEFITNQKKYFDLALNEDVFIQRGGDRFMVTCAHQPVRVRHKEPDEDLRRAITMDELLERTYEVIDKFYASK
jgi:hypothetical protein